MISYRHQIHKERPFSQVIIINTKRETIKLNSHTNTNLEALHFVVDIILLTVIAALFYYALRSRVTGAAMMASRGVWYKSLPVFILALIFAVPMMGVTLGAIISRQILGRNVTVDWYSVIGGTLLVCLIYYIPYISVVTLIILYILTFVALIQSYVVRE